MYVCMYTHATRAKESTAPKPCPILSVSMPKMPLMTPNMSKETYQYEKRPKTNSYTLVVALRLSRMLLASQMTCKRMSYVTHINAT